MKEYLKFELIEVKPKTKVYAVMNIKNNCRIGIIKWYGPWRQYCFFPFDDTLYHTTCLLEIMGFIEGIMGFIEGLMSENQLGKNTNVRKTRRRKPKETMRSEI